MKYFIDTEFLEGTQDKTIFGIKYGQTKPTIDLISIGIVAEDGREYYAVSKDAVKVNKNNAVVSLLNT